MAKVSVFTADSGEWLTGSNAESEGLKAVPDRKEILGGMRRIRYEGSDTELQLFEAKIGPDQEVESHAHVEDEIVYVVGGSMRLGARVLEPGASVYIPGMTLYSFRAGPDGLHYLNFRPRRDETHYSKEQFMTLREAAKTGSSH